VSSWRSGKQRNRAIAWPRTWAPALAVALLGAGLCASPAWAGPPYLTDDPEPTDPGHWEIYAYTQATRVGSEALGEQGLDINYGGAKDLQLTAVLPVESDNGDGRARGGFGDLQLAAKYKIVHQDDKSWLPDISLFPRVSVPTATRFFGDGRTQFFLPVWAEKDWGKWSVFGGGGYTFNPGPDNRNFWMEGVALTRKLTDKFSIGAEIYHQGSDATIHKDLTGIGPGFTWQVLEHYALIGSGGPALQNQTREQQGFYYVAVLVTY
jgi:hypothetical protein